MNKYILSFLLIFNITFSNEKPFDDYDKVQMRFQDYIQTVDAKDIEKMTDFFYYGKGEKTIFHFGNNSPLIIYERKELDEIFKIWKQSPKSEFNRTRLDKINVAPRSDRKEEKLCTVDVTYSRLGDDDKLISKRRSIYHFYRYKNSWIKRFIKKWKEWKIYMVVDVDIESDS